MHASTAKHIQREGVPINFDRDLQLEAEWPLWTTEHTQASPWLPAPCHQYRSITCAHTGTLYTFCATRHP